ncbi:MAG TPA: metal ABC transporter substrate-binding protein, partial [Thermoanaerobaculia bacterium]|nr:metal ABC transporter substrate-binding protein [Thermoanaerobaculia bacterium]
LLIVLSMLALAAGSARADKLKVITTTEDLAWITRAIGGDKVGAQSLARGYQDPHFVEPKPSFLLELRKADLLVVVGLELEAGWLPPLIDQSRNAKIRPGSPGYLDVSAGVEILDRPTTGVDRSMGDIHAGGNPHYWLEPGNAIRMAAQIAARLTELRPEHRDAFAASLTAFKSDMNEANKRWTKMLAPYRGAKIVTYHRSWSNFVKRYGLDVVGFVEPKPGVPPSPSHIFSLVNQMKQQQVKVILVEPYFDLKTPQSIGDRTGAKVVVVYPSVLGRPELRDYYQLFDRNIAAIVDALR